MPQQRAARAPMVFHPLYTGECECDVITMQWNQISVMVCISVKQRKTAEGGTENPSTSLCGRQS